jgi:hypothetical protein
MRRRSAADVAAMLADRVGALCKDLLVGGFTDGNEWRCGSARGEAGKSLGVRLTNGTRPRGFWKDFASGEGGDLLDLVKAHFGFGTIEAMTWAEQWLGLSDGDPRPPRSTPPDPIVLAEVREKQKRLALDIWRETASLSGTLGEHYLRVARGISIDPLPPTLRFHPRLWHGPKESPSWWPAIVGAVQNPQGEISGIWRTWLDASGDGKAKVAKNKMGLGVVKGGALRLGKAETAITIGEGMETCLSAVDAMPGRPTWAGLSSSIMRGIILPASVGDVLLLEDADEPDERGRRAGPEAVADLATRLIAEGRRVRIARPPVGCKDFNDALRAPARGDR